MLGAEDQPGFEEWRELLPGVEVWDEWEDKFILKYNRLTRAEIREFNTHTFRIALHEYKKFKAIGVLPNGTVQNKEKPVIIELITLFDEWMNRMPSWEHDNKDFL